MDERALIFQNLLNGVPVWRVAQEFHKSSEREVIDIFNFVLRKIRSYQFERKRPPVLAETIEQVRKHYHITCLTILPKLKLNKPPTYEKIIDEHVNLRSDGSVTGASILRDLQPSRK